VTGPRPAGTRTRPRTPATDTDRGSSTLGAILVIPVMILLTMLVLQFAMLWHGKHVAAAVAQTGVQGAAGYRSSAADGQAQAEGYLADVAPNLLRDATVTVDRGTGTVTARVSARIPSVLPFTDFDVQETVTGPVERFSSGAGP
jgi:TadE-like protein